MKGKRVSVNRTMHRRLWRRRLGVGLLVVAATLVGCSSDDEGEGVPDPESSPDSSAEPPPQPRRFSVVMSGDVLIHTGVWESAE
ncbi:MAG: hypothetical protein ACRDP2_17550, partial [Nocardioidaceae bacterium]